MQNLRFVAALVVGAGFTAAASAGVSTLPFTEDFETGAAGWTDGAGNPADWFASGGPDGSAFASADLDFNNIPAGTSPVVLRGESGASGDAFAGDWIASGVRSFRVQFRHDAIAPVIPFVRFASPFNFPGAITLGLAPIAANEWTEIAVRIGADNPVLNFEGTDFNTVFSNIGRVQIGLLVGETLGGVDETFRFDIDQATIVPAPGAAAAIGLAGLAGLRRRRH